MLPNNIKTDLLLGARPAFYCEIPDHVAGSEPAAGLFASTVQRTQYHTGLSLLRPSDCSQRGCVIPGQVFCERMNVLIQVACIDPGPEEARGKRVRHLQIVCNHARGGLRL